jgi:hypothetical protein
MWFKSTYCLPPSSAHIDSIFSAMIFAAYSASLGCQPRWHGNGCPSGLQDLLAARIGRTDFSTYIRGFTHIDFVLASPEVVTACTAAGYDPYNLRFSGDHSGMYLDLNTVALFGNETPGLTPPSRRILQSCNSKNRLKYLQAKYKYHDKRNWFNRLDSFTDTSDVTLLESLDRDWVRAGIQAERKCKRHHPFAFVERIAELRNQ